MIFTDGTQNEFKPMNELKLEIKNLQALNIKGLLNFLMNLRESAPNWTAKTPNVRVVKVYGQAKEHGRFRKRRLRFYTVICIKVNASGR